jgi:antitoxin component of MazEF toxin-antitoxin module
MAEFDATLRRVGTSMGVIIPHRVLSQIGAHPGQRIRIVIPEKVDWTTLWAKLRTRAATDELIRGARTDRD